ncbi:putative transcription factor WD40-like family [Helianthus annuus]|nr:putative transcription factor WD40-like family [Helianthus annuus]
MFVKKLVEKASLKKPGGNLDGLKSDEVNPRLIYHYGPPSGCNLLAYDPIQKILAMSTIDGRIKLFGQDNTQFIMESPEAVPSKFLQFIHNQPFLININAKNHIEVWDIDMKSLAHVHVYNEEITSFTVLQRTFYMYVGDSFGNVSVLKFDKDICNITQMQYRIPFAAVQGNPTEDLNDAAVMYILPQPAAESKRILIIYKNGFVTLWSIQDSKPVFTTGGTLIYSQNHDTKKVTAACWACPFGSKVVIGYNNGEILMWSVPHSIASKTELSTDKELSGTQSGPLFKLNLGYKLDKTPIARLKWAYAEGKASRLYVLGASDFASANSLQVVIINEQTETRTTKLGITSPEPCVDFEIVSSGSEQNKHKDDIFLVVGKSGHVYLYDDISIEKYLLQSQTKSPPSLPKELKVRLPYADSCITVAKFITDNPCMISSADEYQSLSKKIPTVFSFEAKQKDGSSSSGFSSFSNFKNIYITGHSNGAINFWDASSPLLIPMVSFNQQSEDDQSLSGVPLTALCYDMEARLLVSGDQSGTVRIFKFKPEPYATESSFLSLQGSSKKGSNIIQSVKLVKVNGAVLSVTTSHDAKHIAIGSDQGYVSVIDTAGPTLLYERHIASELSTAVISLQFGMCSLHGFEKSVLVVATKDSSAWALESETGNILNTAAVHPKKPSKALFIQLLDEHGASGRGSNVKDLLLFCSEKAVYVYSLPHVVQGVKKVCYKKKFNSSTCCWASTCCSDTGLVLVFTNGKIEIRSLPELSLLKATSIRGLALSTSKPNSLPESSICASQNGDIIMVNGDQEVFIASVLIHREIFRHLDLATQVYNKDLILPQGKQSDLVVHKEKKKGIFGSMIKGSKPKHELLEAEPESARESFEELSTLFSVANFPLESETRENLPTDEDDVELDIDDIDIDGPEEKPKGKTMMAALNKKKLTSTFNAFKGKLKEMNVKKEKEQVKEEPQDEKTGVDQIKKKYGFSSTSETTSAAKMAQNKLSDNIRKLKGINLRTAEMQDNAQTFSSMAKDLLRTAENDRRAS